MARVLRRTVCDIREGLGMAGPGQAYYSEVGRGMKDTFISFQIYIFMFYSCEVESVPTTMCHWMS